MDEAKAGPRILLVDDDQAITRHLAPFLERAGFSVAVAGVAVFDLEAEAYTLLHPYEPIGMGG